MDRTGTHPWTLILRLYVEEVRALPRGRYALPGACALIAALTLFAAGPGTWMVGGLWGFAFVAYVLVPTSLAAVVAARVAGVRASSFSHALFTLPVTKARVLAASVLASVTLGALYLAATLPFVLLAARELEGTGWLVAFLGVGAALVLVASTGGTLVGVLFGRAVSAAAGTAAACAVAAVAAVAAVGVLTATDAAPFALRVTHVSPVVLAMGAARVFPFGMAPASPGSALVALAATALGTLALAAWVYIREQGVEAWESAPSRRLAVAGALVVVLLAPAALAGATYEAGGVAVGGAVGSSFHGIGAALVPRGADAATASLGGHREQNLLVGHAHAMDLVVSFPFAAETWANVTDVHVAAVPDARLRLEGATTLTLAGLPEPAPVEGGRAMPVVRLPLTVTPTAPSAFSENVYTLHVNVTFTAPSPGAPSSDAEGERPRTASARIPVLADVPHASVKMALAGAPAGFACFAGALVRRHRTR